MKITSVHCRGLGIAIVFFAISAWADAALTITTQPQSLAANAGSNVILSVAATATSTITYQWQYNGQTLGGASAASLSLNNVQASQDGAYTVLVTGDGTTLTSATARVTVVLPPTIGTLPARTTLVAGSSTTFAPTISGSEPLVYQWKRDGSAILGATDRSFRATTEGSYSLVATNPAGVATSDAAVVVVVEAISITAQPVSQGAPLGGSITLSVTATGPGSLQYLWYKDGTAIPGATASKLLLSNFTDAQNAEYRVNVRNEYQAAGVNSEIAEVGLLPRIITQPTIELPVNVAYRMVGETIELHADVSGGWCLWRQDGRPIVHTYPAPQGSLLIVRALAEDEGMYTVVVTNRYGSVTSEGYVLKLAPNPYGPTILIQPKSQTIPLGAPLFLSVTATDSGPSRLTYAWRKNRINISKAKASSYMVPSVSADDAGDYSVVVRNSSVGLVSTVVHITIGPAAVAPRFTLNPADQYKLVGDTVTLTCAASGTPEPTYQWKKNGIPIESATSTELTLTDLKPSDNGSYTSTASNFAGVVESAPAVISVRPKNRLANFSARGQVGSSTNIMITGFIINGSAPKKMLIRAIGPTLSQFGLEEVLAAPSLQIAASSGEIVASNDNWNNGTNVDELLETQARTGAFPLQKSSKDNALIITLQPGAYTALVSGLNNSSGVALAEMYEADTTTSNWVINTSVRAFVGTGSQVLIAGVVISGDVPTKFLVRAAGPSLKHFGVDGILADPKLEVLNRAGQTIASNDDWSIGENSSETKSIMSSLNVFTFDTGSKDAATVVTLAPGEYTIIIRGVGDTTGVAMVELYQVP